MKSATLRTVSDQPSDGLHAADDTSALPLALSPAGENTANCSRLRALESLRENFVPMVVHDLRAPLTALISSLDFLRSSTFGKLGRTETACLVNAAESAERLRDMINTLLDVSRLEAGQMPLSLAIENLETIAHATASTLGPLLGGRSLVWEMPAKTPRVLCDGTVVRRVLMNLLDNAIRHTGANGTLVFRIEHAPGHLRVSIADDGPGIAPGFHAKIFEKFHQLGRPKKQNTGLGLTFCKLAVEAHGGQIGVQSQPGHGSTFWFTLPAPQPASACALPQE